MQRYENTSRRKFSSKLIFSLIILIFPLILSVLTLKNLGEIVGIFLGGENTGGKFDFAKIFSGTEDEVIFPHFLLPLLFGGLFLAASLFLLSKIKSGALSISLHVLLFIILFSLSLVSSLLFSHVNGIRFFDLLRELIPLIDKL